MPKMTIDNSLDYLRLTGYGLENTLSEIGIINTGITERPQYGYEKCYRLQIVPDEIAGYFMRGKAGELAQFSGKQIEHLRSEGISDTALLHVTKKHKATRLDVAVDVLNGGNTEKHLQKLYHSLKTGKVKTLAQNYLRYQSHNGERTGTTVGIGSRTSMLYMRAYNKAVESNFTEGEWLRIELEAKSDKAVALHQMVNEQGLGKATRAQMEDFMMVDGIYEKAMNKLEIGDVVRFKREKSDGLVFFAKVIMPYLKARFPEMNSSHIAQLELIIEQWRAMQI